MKANMKIMFKMATYIIIQANALAQMQILLLGYNR